MNVDQVSASRRIRRDIDLRRVDCRRERFETRWLHARREDGDRGSRLEMESESHGPKGIAPTEIAQRRHMSSSPSRSRAFLISPATAHGPRAMALRRDDATSVLASRLRAGNASLGEVFSFLSGLYFRGKLEYARAFARSAAGDACEVHIITMTDGLVSPDTLISSADLERYAGYQGSGPATTSPLEATARALRDRIGSDAEVVLLGSVGTGKYTDVLTPIFGRRLLFPRDVLHAGQLARGAIFLQRVKERQELEYVPVADIVRAGGRTSVSRGESPLPEEHAPTETPQPATRPSTGDATAESPQ